jgi:outer membrane protein assembly factor BamB
MIPSHRLVSHFWCWRMAHALRGQVGAQVEEVQGFRMIRRTLLWVLVCVCLVPLLAGCMPRGAASNPGWTVVAADESRVFAALAQGTVVALDAQSGQEVWAYPVQGDSKGGVGGLFSPRDTGVAQPLDAVYGLPVILDDLVLVTSYDHRLYAFEKESGRVAWQFSADGAIIGGTTVRDGVAYFGSSDYKVYAVDVSTGKAVWNEPFETRNWVWGAPAVDQDHVYVGSMDHSVYALQRSDGALVWERNVGGSVPGSVTLEDGLLFVGSINKHLHALRKTDGTEMWSQNLGHWVWGEALVVDGYVYVGSLDGKLHGLSVADGSRRWPAPSLGAPLRAGPALVNGSLVVGTEAGTMFSIDLAQGSAREVFRATGGVLSSAAVVGQKVFLGTTLGNVFALDTGLAGNPQMWVYPPAK